MAMPLKYPIQRVVRLSEETASAIDKMAAKNKVAPAVLIRWLLEEILRDRRS